MADLPPSCLSSWWMARGHPNGCVVWLGSGSVNPLRGKRSDARRRNRKLCSLFAWSVQSGAAFNRQLSSASFRTNIIQSARRTPREGGCHNHRQMFVHPPCSRQQSTHAHLHKDATLPQFITRTTPQAGEDEVGLPPRGAVRRGIVEAFP